MAADLVRLSKFLSLVLRHQPEEIGLTQRVFNTRAICVVDLNGDKVNDVVFNNEGQESAVLLGSPKRAVKKVADAR